MAARGGWKSAQLALGCICIHPRIQQTSSDTFVETSLSTADRGESGLQSAHTPHYSKTGHLRRNRDMSTAMVVQIESVCSCKPDNTYLFYQGPHTVFGDLSM